MGELAYVSKNQKYFFTKKILVRQIIGDTLLATIDETNSIADQTLYTCILKEDNVNDKLEYFLAIINSKLYGFCFRKYYSEEDDLFPKIKVNELKRLPIKKIESSDQKPFIQLVNKILLQKKNSDADTSLLEKEIDNMIYELYGLTDEEVRMVEGQK